MVRWCDGGYVTYSTEYIVYGYMRYKLVSGIMVYSVGIYVLVATNGLLSIKNVYYSVQPTFNDEVDMLLAASMFVPQFVTPVFAWILMRRQQTYFNNWAAFQDNYERVTCARFPSVSELAPSKLTLCVYYVLTAVVITVLLPYYVRDDFRWYYAPSFCCSVLGSLLHFWYWTLTSNVISVVARKFQANFRKEIMKRNGYTARVEEYRLLWLELNQLIRKCGSCSSYIVSTFILWNIFCLVVVTYDVAFAFSTYINSNRAYVFVDGLMLVYIWWLFMYAYCNAGYRMMECAVDGTLETIVLLRRNGSFDEELRTNLFLFTLRKCRPKATISGYYAVNRGLFGSIAASLFTYILVVKQFHLSKISVTNQPLSRNGSN